MSDDIQPDEGRLTGDCGYSFNRYAGNSHPSLRQHMGKSRVAGGGAMTIKLKVDYDGQPYLELARCYGDRPKQQLLELFIRRARENGVIIRNESNFDTSNTYASIRIKETETQ